MHHSAEGEVWRFVRARHVDLPSAVKVSVRAQAPFGPGCSAEFRLLHIHPEAVRDFRSGECPGLSPVRQGANSDRPWSAMRTCPRA
jgi:hypothetical protein